VCVSAVSGLDTIFIAPTGHGKSLCFTVPALAQGGITLVIEPLKAIIEDQIIKFTSNAHIQVEALQSLEDMQRKGGVRAEQHLCQIANKMTQRSFEGPLILFCTAELALQEGVLTQLERIDKNGELSRFVLDEFDVAGEATESWREMYPRIIPTLRQKCPNVPFSLLSATTSKKDFINLVRGLVDNNASKRNPHVFLHPRPLADSLAFSVERKVNNAQVTNQLSPQCTSNIEAYDVVKFSEINNYLIAGSRETIEIWDVSDLKNKIKLGIPFQHLQEKYTLRLYLKIMAYTF